jgi:hypothetical protein
MGGGHGDPAPLPKVLPGRGRIGWVCRRITRGAQSELGGFIVIILGIILLVVGFLLAIPILWTLGVILVVIGLILVVLGSVGHAVGGRRHYF